MIGLQGLNGLNAYYRFPGGGSYGGSYEIAAAVRNAQSMGKISPVGYGAKRAASPETPVEQVRPVTAVQSEAAAPINRTLPSWRMDAGEEAVRMRIQYAQNMPQEGTSDAARVEALLGKNTAAQEPANAPEAAWNGMPAYAGMDAAEMAVRLRIQYPGAEDDAATAAEAGKPADEAENAAEPSLKIGKDGSPVEKNPLAEGKSNDEDNPGGVEGVQKAAEEGRCETCEKRKYQDESDDSSVSFQNPTRIAPENVASAVRGHEMEHVSHEQLKAEQEGRKVVSQTVTLHTDICPECGKTYISGGTTRTVTAAASEPVAPAEEAAPADQKVPAGLGIA